MPWPSSRFTRYYRHRCLACGRRLTWWQIFYRETYCGSCPATRTTPRKHAQYHDTALAATSRGEGGINATG